MPDMSVSDLLQAFLANQAAHTQGHMASAEQMGMPSYVDWQRGVEVVPPWVSNPQTEDQRRAATMWHGAGFMGQQNTGKQAEGGSFQQPYDLAQGLYKALYSLGVKPSGISGDIENMERISGNRYVKPLLGVSALSDLYRAYNPDAKFGIDFVAPQGAPGIQLNFKHDWFK